MDANYIVYLAFLVMLFVAIHFWQKSLSLKVENSALKKEIETLKTQLDIIKSDPESEIVKSVRAEISTHLNAKKCTKILLDMAKELGKKYRDDSIRQRHDNITRNSYRGDKLYYLLKDIERNYENGYYDEESSNKIIL